MQGKKIKHLYLIDGSGYIFRAYFGYPKMNRKDGTPTNAVYGFCTMISKLLSGVDADYVGVIFDRARKNFRNDIYPAYKAQREQSPEDLVPQFSIIRDACKAYNIAAVDMANYEADDLIATYAKQASTLGAKVTIVSSDKDLMQLVGGQVNMYDPMKKLEIGPQQVFEKFGVYPEKVIDLQALAGDSSDNVPGVPTIGVKTAALLINEFESLDNLLKSTHLIKQQKRKENLINFADQALLSRRLVTLKDDVEVEQGLDFFKRKTTNLDDLKQFFTENDFARLLANVDKGQGTAEFKALPTKDNNSKNKDVDNFRKKLLFCPETSKNYIAIDSLADLKLWLKNVEKSRTVTLNLTWENDLQGGEPATISLCAGVGVACSISLESTSEKLGVNGRNLLGESKKSAPQKEMDLFAEPSNENSNPLIANSSASAVAKDTLTRALFSFQSVIEVLRPYLQSPTILKIACDFKTIIKLLDKFDVQLTSFDDVSLMSFCCDAGANSHNIDKLSNIHLDFDPQKRSDLIGRGKNKLLFSQLTTLEITDYSCELADIIYRLHLILKQRLVEKRVLTIYEYIERPLIKVIAKMETSGILVDIVKLKELSAKFNQEILKTKDEINKVADIYALENFNLTSPKQLGELLFNHMGLKFGKKTKTGTYSTNAEVLENLIDEHPIIKQILRNRTYCKLKSTYSDALQSQVASTGRIHTCFNMLGAQTGRLSSLNPNLQNIPARTADGQQIRDCFIAKPDYKLLSLDYSQIELRIIASIADDSTMIDAFKNNIDIHAQVASNVFNVPMSEVNKQTRSRAKAINFGIIYGVSAYGLAKQIGCSRSDAKTFIENYFLRFPKIADYMTHQKQLVRENGFVQTLMGRKINLPTINDTNAMLRSHADRQAINAPIQGSSADIIKLAMIQIESKIAGDKNINMLLQVHDELIFEVHKDFAAQEMSILKSIMQQSHTCVMDIKVPLVVEGQIGTTWNEAH